MHDEPDTRIPSLARFLQFSRCGSPRAELFAWVFLTGAIIGIRLFVAHLVPFYLWSRDAGSYAAPAFQWMHTGVWETDPRRGPVYSLVIALCLKIGGGLDSLMTLQHVLGGASVLLAIVVLRRLCGPRALPAVVLCGYAYAVYPLPLALEHLVRNETLLFVFATLAFASWFFAIKRDDARWLWLCGISTGLLILTKNVFGPFPLVVLAAQIFLHKTNPRFAAKHAAIFLAALALPLLGARLLDRLTPHTRPPEPQSGILLYGRTAQFTVLDGGIEPEVKKLIRKDIEDYRKLPRLDNNIILKRTAVPHMQAHLEKLGKTPSDLNRLCRSLAVEAIRANKLRYLQQMLRDCWVLNLKFGSRVWSPNANDLESSKATLLEAPAPDPLLQLDLTLRKLDARNSPGHFSAYRAWAHTAWMFRLAPVLLTSLLLPFCVHRERSPLRWWWIGAASVWYFTIALLCTFGRPLDRYLLPVAPIMFWTLGTASACLLDRAMKRFDPAAKSLNSPAL